MSGNGSAGAEACTSNSCQESLYSDAIDQRGREPLKPHQLESVRTPGQLGKTLRPKNIRKTRFPRAHQRVGDEEEPVLSRRRISFSSSPCFESGFIVRLFQIQGELVYFIGFERPSLASGQEQRGRGASMGNRSSRCWRQLDAACSMHRTPGCTAEGISQ